MVAWNQATWLCDVVTERLAKLPRDKEHQAQADYNNPGAYERWRRRRVEQLLNTELIEGWHAIYAANPGEPPHEINQIAPEIMVHVTLDSEKNAARGKRIELINMRLVLGAGEASRSAPKARAKAKSPPHKKSDLGLQNGQRGAKTVDLTSRPSRVAANKLYQKLGFVLRDTNVYRFAEPSQQLS